MMICFLVLVKIEQMVEGEFQKVGFQHKSKWRTGSSAFYDIIGMYVVGMIQGVISDQFNYNSLMQSKVISIFGIVIIYN